MNAIRPFKLEIKEEEIKDLNSRLLNTRLLTKLQENLGKLVQI